MEKENIINIINKLLSLPCGNQIYCNELKVLFKLLAKE